MIEKILQQIGLSEREIVVYLTCLKLGPASVRKIADAAQINRGTTYDTLKLLRETGLISYYHKDTKQYFIAEDPSRLRDAIESRQTELEKTKTRLDEVIPQLKSMYDKAGEKPVVKYYEGKAGVKTILADVLQTSSRGSKEYFVYSSSTIKGHLYNAYPDFSKQRVAARVKVKTISIGPGGSTVGLDERKWLTKKETTPTYTLLYEGKVAMISVSVDSQPIGVIIEDKNIFETQKMIFEFVWQQIN